MKTPLILLPPLTGGPRRAARHFFARHRPVVVVLLLLLASIAASARSTIEGEFLRRDLAKADRTTSTPNDPGETVVTRDRHGRATRVSVKDSKGRLTRHIRISYDENGDPTTTTVDYRQQRQADGTWKPVPVTEVTTTWHYHPGLNPSDDRFEEARRVTTTYDPVRTDAHGDPLPMRTKTEIWEGGRWVERSATEGRSDQEQTSQLGRPLEQLVEAGQVAVALTGSGETIGTVATLKLTNRSDQPLTVRVPPLLLVCGSGEYQNYACPVPQTVALKAKASKAVRLDGVCLVRGKLPVPKGKGGDLIAQDAEGNAFNTASGKIKPFAQKKATTLLKTSAAYYQAAEKLQKQGAYKKMPYSAPKKQKEIAVQWGVWSDPAVAKISGEKPAAKEDLAKTIYKQAEAKGPVTPATKVKLDQGIDELFESIELTGKAAKEIASQPAAAAAKVSFPNGAKRHSCLAPDRLFSSSSGRSTSPAYDKAALLFPSQLL